MEQDPMEGFFGGGGSDHPNGVNYETQSERFGYSSYETVKRPKMQVERKFIFGIPEIKELIIEYLKVAEGITIHAEDIKEDITGSDYRDQRDFTRANAVFTATIKD